MRCGRLWSGEGQNGGGKTRSGHLGLSVISCSKYKDKLVGHTMRCVEFCVRHS